MYRRATLLAAPVAALLAAISGASPALAEQQVTDPASGCRIWDQYPDARKTIRWTGPCRDGFANGEGLLEWAYDGRYDGRARGTFLDGRLDGRAQVEWHDGRRMDGSFRQGRASGQGTFVWPDGRRYTGDWEDDRRTGYGTLEYPDGRRYVGQFHRNRPTGEGESSSASGASRTARGTVGSMVRPDPAPEASGSSSPPSDGPPPEHAPPGSFEEWLRRPSGQGSGQ